MTMATARHRLLMETRLLLASPSNRAALAAFTLLLLLSAVWSGINAKDLRAQRAATIAAAGQLIEQTRNTVITQATLPPLEAAQQAFTFGRSDAAPALLPPGGGAVLSPSRFALLTPEARVSVDSRLADARRGEGLDNPLLAGLGQPDLASITAILAPLAALVLCAGLVQRDRTLGLWRALRVQTISPLRLLALRLSLRATALALIMIIASLPGFLLDCDFSINTNSNANLNAALLWFVLATAYIVLWVAIGGALCLLRVTTATALTAGIALWLGALFVAPALLQTLAERAHPPASSLAGIIALRANQLQFEEQEQALLEDWYARHPAWPPPAGLMHTWPVTFLPRHAALDQQLRPLLRQQDEQRAARFLWLERYGWLSPPLALVMAADRLAGIDTPRHTRFVHAADRFEDQWRALIVPRVMSYRGLDAAFFPEAFDPFPGFEPPALSSAGPVWKAWWHLIALTGCAIVTLLLGRGRLQAPE